MAEKYELDIPEYQGVDQTVEVKVDGQETVKDRVVGLAERQG